eukprot:CAMPEP_0115322924 /NCGR_PEP_ID=MMETSP0270-20121206/81659_1 /TAXON_ID=71861 /ORGANISM="Scrippsiella trochoidea, Strain CCMP3099" /LENGTH=47 /DNA_ID= /DNA_START= /DNA_END= /DNA_ORIENTATION=
MLHQVSARVGVQTDLERSKTTVQLTPSSAFPPRATAGAAIKHPLGSD